MADELFILPIDEQDGGGTSYEIVQEGDPALDMTVPTNHPILLKMAFIVVKKKPSINKVDNLASFEKQTGLQFSDIVGINGQAVRQMLDNPADVSELTKYVYLIAPNTTFLPEDTILHAQKVFLIVFHNMLFLAFLDKKPVKFQTSFEEKFKMLQDAYSANKEKDGKLFNMDLKSFKEYVDTLNADEAGTETLNTYLTLLLQTPKDIYDFFKGKITTQAKDEKTEKPNANTVVKDEGKEKTEKPNANTVVKDESKEKTEKPSANTVVKDEGKEKTEKPNTNTVVKDEGKEKTKKPNANTSIKDEDTNEETNNDSNIQRVYPPEKPKTVINLTNDEVKKEPKETSKTNTIKEESKPKKGGYVRVKRTRRKNRLF